MKVSRVDSSATRVTLSISADNDDLEPIKRHVLGHFADRVKVPGFREGKAPVNVVEKHIDQRLLVDDFMEHALNDLYRLAMKSSSIFPARIKRANRSQEPKQRTTRWFWAATVLFRGSKRTW
jgi:FKBP-type peptidyl-prolyl cis-trans isomerase (trigger factor)